MINALAPPNPPNENRPGGAVLGVQRKLQPDNRQASQETQLLQWRREAARLFNEFWRTGQRAHLDALTRHLIAMRYRIQEKAHFVSKNRSWIAPVRVFLPRRQKHLRVSKPLAWPNEQSSSCLRETAIARWIRARDKEEGGNPLT